MLLVCHIRTDLWHLEKRVQNDIEHARDSISWRQNFLRIYIYTVATLIVSDLISLGKTVAATQFPGDRFSCDTGQTYSSQQRIDYITATCDVIQVRCNKSKSSKQLDVLNSAIAHANKGSLGEACKQ